jgi:hypothetical protein
LTKLKRDPIHLEKEIVPSQHCRTKWGLLEKESPKTGGKSHPLAEFRGTALQSGWQNLAWHGCRGGDPGKAFVGDSASWDESGVGSSPCGGEDKRDQRSSPPAEDQEFIRQNRLW